MNPFSVRRLRQLVGLVLLSGLLSVTCHPYRLPNPKAPPRPKVSKAKKPGSEMADGNSASSGTEVKPVKNSYDKHGLMKKPKYERRRLKTKVGQRKILGLTLPF
jgi:hypothetical protein